MMTQIEEKSTAKINALEQRDALAAQVSENHREVTHKVQQVAAEFQTIETKIGSQLEGMFSKFLEWCQTKNFAELESNNKAAIGALRNEYQTGYSEIKELLSNSPKTRRVETVAGP